MTVTTTDLAPFDGREVATSTVSVTNAGDGLSKAMKVDPVELHIGDRVYVVLECTVSKLRFDSLKEVPEQLERVHILKAGRATLVDGDQVAAALDEQQSRIDEAEGQPQLPYDDDEDSREAPDEPTRIGTGLDEALDAARSAEADDSQE